MGDFSAGFFSGRPLPAKSLGAFARAAVPDGILSGFTVSYSGATLTVAAGTMIACGRVFSLSDAKSLALTGATSGYARVIVQIDLAGTNSDTAFEQVAFATQYATAADGFAALTQDDVNAGGTLYQVELCRAQLSTSGIAEAELSLPRLPEKALSIELLWENDSPTSSFAAQTIDVDTDDCDLVYAVYATSTDYPRETVGALGVAAQDISEMTYYYASTGNVYRPFWGKGTTSYPGGVRFGNATMDGATKNTRLVPLRIYGIKGVK